MMMALSLSSLLGSTHISDSEFYRRNCLNSRFTKSSSARIQKIRQNCVLINCKSEELEAGERVKGGWRSTKLVIGSPVIVIEAPLFLKTAASVPCLRANSGLVKPGDVGRIMSRKPKDVWAVRLSIGTYLIDGKYFKPLELDHE